MPVSESMEIIEAVENDMTAVERLFRQYQQWLNVDLFFQGFEKELAELPGCYARPEGSILLAQHENQFIGCVAVRPHEGQQAELKRLFVQPDFHGRGIGKRLFIAAMEKAMVKGYTSIVLDTLPSMQTAQSMYKTYGFRSTEPYCDNPIEGVKYFRYDFAGQ